jgi:hypothetical protein
MTASQHKEEPARTVAGKTRWLAALERELKSRVGWVDEAVSPFAGRSLSPQVPSKIQRNVFPAEKAA